MKRVKKNKVTNYQIELKMMSLAKQSGLSIDHIKKMITELNNAGERPTNVQKLLRLEVITSSLNLEQ